MSSSAHARQCMSIAAATIAVASLTGCTAKPNYNIGPALTVSKCQLVLPEADRSTPAQEAILRNAGYRGQIWTRIVASGGHQVIGYSRFEDSAIWSQPDCGWDYTEDDGTHTMG